MKEQVVENYNAPAVVRGIAKAISYLFHPLFIPTYVYVIVSVLFPFEFTGRLSSQPGFRTLVVFINTAFFPAFAVFLLWRLKFIESIFLRTQRERIAPYIITMVFYWWVWYLSKNFTDQPFALRIFFLGIFLTTPVALIVNNFMKISMHAIGVGSAAAFIIILGFIYDLHLGIPISIAVLVTGIVCTARLSLRHHNNAEVYYGLALGVACQLLAAWFTF